MNNNQALKSYFDSYCPELRVLFHHGYRIGGKWSEGIQISFGLEVEFCPDDEPELVKSLFLDELYKIIGKFTVIAEKMRSEPVLRGSDV